MCIGDLGIIIYYIIWPGLAALFSQIVYCLFQAIELHQHSIFVPLLLLLIYLYIIAYLLVI